MVTSPAAAVEGNVAPVGVVHEFVGAIDQGTQSTKFTLYDHNLLPRFTACAPHAQFFPKSGWVEHDAEEIVAVTRKVLGDVVQQATDELGEIRVMGIGVANQRETVIAWNKKTGVPLHKAIVWLDTRTKSIVDEWVEKLGSKDALREKTGLPINTYFSSVKIQWLIRNVPAVREALEEGNCCFGTIDTWVIWNLTGGPHVGSYVTDVTNASRYNIMNINTREWDADLLRLYKIPVECLPEIRSCSEHFGFVVGIPGLEDTPISGCAGDQQAACIGQGLFSKGRVKCTYGTGAFVLMHTGDVPVQSTEGLLTTVCYQFGQNATVSYALEGASAIAGAGVSWMRDNLNAVKSPKETEALITSVKDTCGVYFVPAFAGLFAPRWRPDARGVIMGLTQYSTRAHIVRSLFEAIGFQLNEIVQSMRADTHMQKIGVIKVDGGMTQNEPFLQITADLCGCTVERPKDIEVTSKGAAIAAGLACGFFKSIHEVETLLEQSSKRWHPEMPHDVWEKRVNRWNEAVLRSLNWA